MTNSSVIVVGAGIAGLTAAYQIKKAGCDVLVLEVNDYVGGRMANVEWEGFLVDVGAKFVTTTDRTLLNLVQEVGLGEQMLLLQRRAEPSAAANRLSTAALTPREAEVLSWVAKGKTNRDVGDILGMSPRTVNKHLEHVFEKLGVETRTAAAAMAMGKVRGLEAGR